MSRYPVVDWIGLYGEGWGEDIVPEAFSHPAKYSRALIRHIYQYLLDNKLIERGAKVLDPFGGVALGALDAQLQGLHWVGCELEPKFVALGNLNLELWRKRYAPHFSRWGSAQLMQGDSRRLGEVIAGKVGGVVSSPPYADQRNVAGDQAADPGMKWNNVTPSDSRQGAPPNKDWYYGRDYGTSPGQLGAMPSGDVNAIIASPPFGDAQKGGGISATMRGEGDYKVTGPMPGNLYQPSEHGETEGNLGNMPVDDFSAIVASPPFIQTSGGTNVTSTQGPLSDPSLISRHSAGNQATEAYGESSGQLQNMKEGDVNAIISSPPYAGIPITNDKNYEDEKIERLKAEGKTANRATWGHNKGSEGQSGYGKEEGQLQNMREGDIQAVIASPPYSAALVQRVERPDTDNTDRMNEMGGNMTYGYAEGQLAQLPEGDVEAIISSPPYAGTDIGANEKRDGQDRIEALQRAQARGEKLGRESLRVLEKGLNKNTNLNAEPGGYGVTEGQLGALPEGDVNAVISSPPFTGVIPSQANQEWHQARESIGKNNSLGTGEYGNSEGQLAHLPEGDVNAVISSPPYASQSVETGKVDETKWSDGRKRSIGASQNQSEGYGETDGQLGSASEGDFDSVVSSPPYEGIEQSGGTKGIAEHGTGLTQGQAHFAEYGASEGQLGREEGDSFWSASLAIVSQCYQLLAPGGVAVWVCKDYVRNKKRVPFSDQWRMLCEKVGFTTLTEVHAWVIEDNGTQLAFGETEDKAHRKERKSFFRRLAEKKGSPRIDWETVWIMTKPVDTRSNGSKI